MAQWICAAVRSGPWVQRLAHLPFREAGYALQRNTPSLAVPDVDTI
jgi:hypothetical protein